MKKIISIPLALIMFGMSYAFAYYEDFSHLQNDRDLTTTSNQTFFQLGIVPYFPGATGWLQFCFIFNISFQNFKSLADEFVIFNMDKIYL